MTSVCGSLCYVEEKGRVKIMHVLHPLAQAILENRVSLCEAREKTSADARHGCFSEADVDALDKLTEETANRNPQLARYLAILNNCVAQHVASEEKQGYVMITLADLNIQIGMDENDPTTQKALAEEAIPLYNKAFKIYSDLKCTQAQAAILCALIPAYQTAGELEKALNRSYTGVALAQEIAAPEIEAACYRHLGNLGIAYRQQGSPTKAISCYEQVLEYYREIKDQRAEGQWLGNLALAQRDLGQLKEALTSAQAALKLAERAGDTMGEIIVKNMLGILHYELGDMEAALEYCRAALEDSRRATDRQKEYVALICIGLLYHSLGQFNEANDYFKSALSLAQSISNRQAESYALVNLGIIQREQGKPETAIQLLEKAQSSKDALAEYTEAVCLNNLGLARWDLGQLCQATQDLENALKINSRIGYVRGETRNLGNLGEIYFLQYKLTRARDKLDEACDKLDRALQLSRETGEWESQWRMDWHLGEVYGYGYEQWGKALDHLEKAIGLLEKWRTAFPYDLLRRQAMQDKVAVYQQAVVAACRLQRFDRAIELAGQAKTRYLADVLTRRNSQPAHVSKELRQEYLEKFDRLQRQWQAYLSVSKDILPSHDPTENTSKEKIAAIESRQQEAQKALDESQKEFNKVVRQIHANNPDFQAALHTEPLVFHDIRELAPTSDPETALVEIFVTPQGTATFIVTGDQERLSPENVLWEDGFTENDLNRLMGRRNGDVSGGGWTDEYTRYRKHCEDCDQHLCRTCDHRLRWCATMDQVTEELWSRLFARIHGQLQKVGVKKLVLIPHQALNLIPLQALHQTVCNRRRYLLDDYEVTFAPSAFILKQCQARVAQNSDAGRSLLAVIGGELPGMKEQVALMRDLSTDRWKLHVERASKKTVQEHLADYSHLYFVCHGTYDWKDPLNSALMLLSDLPRGKPKYDPLTLREIQDRDLSHVRLILLSACETAMTSPDDRASEYVGLPAGFLMAGAPAIIASLWAVDEEATMFLLTRFYEEAYRNGKSLPSALREAQRWVRNATANELVDVLNTRLAFRQRTRDAVGNELADDDKPSIADLLVIRRNFKNRAPDERPFEHPFYWGAFTFSGACNDDQI